MSSWNHSKQTIQQLFDAVDRNDTRAVRHLVGRVGVPVDTCSAGDGEHEGGGETSLHRACVPGDSHAVVVRVLLELGADANALNHRGQTPWALTMSNGSVEVMRVFAELSEMNVEWLHHDELIDLARHVELLRFLLRINESFRHKYARAIFLQAAQDGRMATVQWCLDAGEDPNALCEFDKTALHFASYNNDAHIAQALVCAGAHLDVRDTRGRTPLVIACEEESLCVLEILLDAGADAEIHPQSPSWTQLEQAIEDGMTDVARMLLEVTNRFSHPKTVQMLQRAVEVGDYETAKRLHEAGVDIGVSFGNGMTALHYACSNGDDVMVRYLLDAHVAVDVVDDVGETPLFIAAREGRRGVAIIRALVQAGADVNIQCSDDDSTPLIQAIRYGTPSMCNALLESCSRVDASDHFGRTALHHAVESGAVRIVTFLLEANASVDAMDQFGRTPLMDASVNGCSEVAQQLLDAGANTLLECAEGKTALFFACWEGRVDTVRLLLENNAPVGATDDDGYTPLHAACSQGALDVCWLLVDREAPLNSLNMFGQTPLHIACAGGHYDTVNMLLCAGARVQTAQTDGSTPMHTASEEGFDNIVGDLLEWGADPRAIDKEQRGPLCYASKAGHCKVVKLLLPLACNMDVALSLRWASEKRDHDAMFLLVPEMHLRRGK